MRLDGDFTRWLPISTRPLNNTKNADETNHATLRTLQNLEGLLVDLTSAYVGTLGSFQDQYKQKREGRHRRGESGEHTKAEWKALKKLYDYSCLKRGRKEPEIKLTRDHVILLGLPGGTNNTDNIQPLCRDCNQDKSDTHIYYRPVARRWYADEEGLQESRSRVDGLILWQKSLPQVRALQVLETSAGDFILAGELHWIKFDSQGDLLWQHTFAGPFYHTGLSFRFVEESNGNIVAEAPTSRTVFNADGELQSFTETTGPASVINRLDANQFIDMVFARTTTDGGAIVANRVVQDVGDVANMVSHVVISRFSENGSVLASTLRSPSP